MHKSWMGLKPQTGHTVRDSMHSKSLTWTVTIKMTSVVAPFFQSLTISSSSRPFFNCCPKSPSKESSQNACNIWYIWQYLFQYINIYIFHVKIFNQKSLRRTPAIFAAADYNDCHEDDKDDYQQHFHQHHQWHCHLVDHEHSVPHNVPSPSVIGQVLTGEKFAKNHRTSLHWREIFTLTLLQY